MCLRDESGVVIPTRDVESSPLHATSLPRSFWDMYQFVVYEQGPSDVEYKEMLGRLLTASRVDAILLLVIVVLMGFKPGT